MTVCPGLQRAAALGGLDDAERQTILDRAQRIERLDLGVEIDIRRRELVEPHDRGAADGLRECWRIWRPSWFSDRERTSYSAPPRLAPAIPSGQYNARLCRARPPMLFERVTTGGCQSYLVGCAETCAAALIDPEISQIDRYVALAARDGVRIRYVDRHAHARRSFLGHARAGAPARRARRHAPREPRALRRHAGRRRRDASCSASCACR